MKQSRRYQQGGEIKHLKHYGYVDEVMLDTIFLWISFGQPPQQGVPIFLGITGFIILCTWMRLRKGN